MNNAERNEKFSNIRYSELERYGRVRTDVLGSDLTTFNVGGALACIFEPADALALQSAIQMLHSGNISYRMIGAGSNIIISDCGVPEVVVKLGQKFRAVTTAAETGTHVTFEIGAAASLMTLARTVSENGLSGLEFAGGIPASVGGAIFMNAGAHGADIASVLQTVEILRDGKLERIPAKEFPFAYRHSGIEAGAIVVGAAITLKRGDKREVAELRAKMLRERKLKQPLTFPSAGSVFKNPSPELSAGQVIERCGLKGKQCGGAQISTLHANWIVNPQRKASAQDVVSLMQACIFNARQAGIHLQPELITW